MCATVKAKPISTTHWLKHRHCLDLTKDRLKRQVYPGYVIGINNPGNFATGDTLYTDNQKVAFEGIPLFSPEIYTYIQAPNPSDHNPSVRELCSFSTKEREL